MDVDLNHHRAFPFLAAFNDIERHLRHRLSARHSDSFSRMVRDAERIRILGSQEAETLLEYAELRNAISHGEYDESFQPIAEPNVDTLRRIEKIRDQLLHPATALQVLGGQRVETYSPSTTFGELLRARHGKYPVYSEGSFITVVQDQDVVRWIATRPRTDSLITIDTNDTIDELLRSEVMTISRKSCVFLGRNATPTAVITAMTTPLDGHLPSAIIINESGKPHQKPLRIVTGSDVALLVEKLSRA